MKHFICLLAIVLIVGCGGRAPVVPTQPATPTPTPAAPAPTPTVVFTGDSTVYNWGQPWASADFQQFSNWTDVGVIGDDSGQIADRFQSQVIDRHPDVVVIEAGVNDVYEGWVLCGDEQGPGYNDHNHDSCRNIDYMVQAAKLNGIKVVLTTIPPWNCADQSVCKLATGADPSPGRYDRINLLNGWIKAYAAQQGVTVADYWSALVSGDGKEYTPGLTVDGVHCGPEGYVLQTPLVQAAIKQAVGR